MERKGREKTEKGRMVRHSVPVLLFSISRRDLSHKLAKAVILEDFPVDLGLEGF